MKLLVKMVSKMGFPYPLKVGKALVGNDVQRVAPVKPSVKVLDVAPVWMVTVILLPLLFPAKQSAAYDYDDLVMMMRRRRRGRRSMTTIQRWLFAIVPGVLLELVLLKNTVEWLVAIVSLVERRARLPTIGSEAE